MQRNYSNLFENTADFRNNMGRLFGNTLVYINNCVINIVGKVLNKDVQQTISLYRKNKTNTSKEYVRCY